MASFERTDRPAAHDDALDERAADWLARRDAGFTNEERAAFERWLAADERHRQAVDELAAAWSLVNAPRLAGQAGDVVRALALRDRNRRATRRRTWAGLAASGLAAALVVLAFLPNRPAPAAPPAASVVAASRPARQMLADGSVVELKPGAEIALEFSAERRGVRLIRGEGHFIVAKDPGRPFVVTAANVAVRAIGTEFIVRHATQAIDVLVTEGEVAVAHVPDAGAASDGAVRPMREAQPVRVGAGAAVTMSTAADDAAAPEVRRVSPAQVTAALAWRGRRVEFTGTALVDAIALFNRQNAVQLTLADRSLDRLRVSGIFWSDDPEGFARLLEGSMGVRTQRRGAHEIALRPAP